MTEPTEADERAGYIKALPELLATLPPDEVVDVIDMSNHTRCVRGYLLSPNHLRRGSIHWLVTTVKLQDGGMRRTFWRGYLDLDTNTHKLSNVGFQYEP